MHTRSLGFAAALCLAACGSASPGTHDAATNDSGTIDDASIDAATNDGPALDGNVAPTACVGQPIMPLSGQQAMVISALEIGEIQDGFDLDGDGEPDNKMAALRALAQSAIDDALANLSLIMPMELFDYPVHGADDCVKLAFYRGSCAGCMPYDELTPDTLTLDPTSLEPGGSARYRFDDGSTTQSGGSIDLDARYGVVTFKLPVTDDLVMELPISHAIVTGQVEQITSGVKIRAGRVGGILAVRDMDKVFGMNAPEIGLLPEESFLDATFANIFGPLLGLAALPDSSGWGGCRTPDIDMDGDGLEAFCDTDFADASQTVGVCIDGDGTVVYDTLNGDGSVAVQCTEAVGDDGKPRFVDGISIELNFATVPALLSL